MVINTSPLTSWDKALPKSGIVTIFGQRGSGKTALAFWLAERFLKKGRQVLILKTSRIARSLLPKQIGNVDSIKGISAKHDAVVIVDEAAFQAMARKHQSPDNILWSQLAAICRHKGHLLIFVAQHSRQIDINLIGDADLVVFKRPSILHIRFTRPELRVEVEEAFKKLSELGKKAVHWSFVKEYSLGQAGLLKNSLPSFWSEKLSRAFALVVLETKPQKKVTVRRMRIKHA